MSNTSEDELFGGAGENTSQNHHHHQHHQFHQSTQASYKVPNDTYSTGPQRSIFNSFNYSAMDERLHAYNSLVMEEMKKIITDENNTRKSNGEPEMVIPHYTPLNKLKEGAGIYWIEDKGKKIGIVTIPQYIRELSVGATIPRQLLLMPIQRCVSELLGSSVKVASHFFFTDFDMEDRSVNRATNLARYIVKELDYFTNKGVNFTVNDIKRTTQLRVNSCTEHTLSYWKQNSPSMITPPCDFGMTLEFTDKDPNSTSGWKPLACVLMYLTAEGPYQYQNGNAYRPVVNISGIHTKVESPGLLSIVLAKVCQQIFESERWKDIFFHKGKDGLKINTLFRHENDESKFMTIGSDEKSIMDAINTAFIPAPKIVVEYVNGGYNPFSYHLLFGKRTDALAESLSTFFDLPVIAYGSGATNGISIACMGRKEPWGQIVGTYGEDSSTITDSRNFTYMRQATLVGRMPDMTMDILTKKPNVMNAFPSEDKYLETLMEITSGAMPSFRPFLYEELIDLDLSQSMGPVLELIKRTDLFIGGANNLPAYSHILPQDPSATGAMQFAQAIRGGQWNVYGSGTQTPSRFGSSW